LAAGFLAATGFLAGAAFLATGFLAATFLTAGLAAGLAAAFLTAGLAAGFFTVAICHSLEVEHIHLSLQLEATCSQNLHFQSVVSTGDRLARNPLNTGDTEAPLGELHSRGFSCVFNQ
jgi:hypothetical protein